jgi:hypothetical protein
VTSTLALFLIWSVSSNVSYDGRHIASASIACIPLALQQACRWWRSGAALGRLIPASAGVAYIALPLLMAGLLVVGAAIHAPTDYDAGPSGVYNPLFAISNLATARAELLQEYDPRIDIWYVPDPVTALDLPGRVIIEDVALTRVPALASYHTSARVRVRALVPTEFEQNGLGDVVRASFVGPVAWTKSPLNGSRYAVWTTLVPSTRPESAHLQPVAARVW